MSEPNEPEADAARLAAEVQEARANNRRSGGAGGKNGLLLGTALATACAGIVAFMFWPQTDPATETSLPTAQPASFQSSDETAFPPRMERPRPAAPATPEPDPALLTKITALEAEIERLRQRPAEPAPEPAAEDPVAVEDTPVVVDDPQIDSLLTRVQELQEAMTTLQADNDNSLAERDRELAQLQAQLDAARIAGGNPDLGTDGVMDRRQEAEALYQARVASPMIAFGGNSGGGGDAAGGDFAGGDGGYPGADAPDPNLRGQSQNERFARQQAARTEMERAKVIANPANTVLQGTMIQAVLETAINTDLPGAVRAVVTEDVHAFDGSRVLIPRGSRVIGAYNDTTDLGQRRAMIVWNRLILPDNQTVSIGATGGDPIGRAGMDGVVRTHFGARFGSATLISLVGIAPALALSGNDDDDDSASDVADVLSANTTGALQGTLGDYLNRQPTIAVKQGALVTIMVDRDLEIL